MTVLTKANGFRPHYLEVEFRDLITTDTTMWSFLQQGSLDGVWYWDLEHPENEWMSPEFWMLFGIDPNSKEHTPSAWQDIIFPEDLDTALENFEKHCNDPSHPYDQIVRYAHADGSTVWVRCRGVAIRDEKGRAVRMLGAHNDVTAVKRAEEKALQESAKLKLANDELTAFTYGVSHDLKSPSRTALQLVQEGLLSDHGNLTDDQREMFEGAIETLHHMQTLIADLLDYGILVDQSVPEETIDLNQLMHAVLVDMDDDLSKAKARVDIGDLPIVKGYGSQLRTLAHNLLTNAIRYRREDVAPVIRIEMGPELNRTLPIRFIDNACGIPSDQFDKIFGVFTRLHRQDEVNGSGVGLAICKRVAFNHDATLTVTSRVGQGSTFELNFPTQRFRND